MTALNLSPKNPLVVVLLAGAAIWAISRSRTATAAVPAPVVGAAAVNGDPIARLLSAIPWNSWFGRPAGETQAQMIAREAGAAAVKWGDPYYGGPDAATGAVPWLEQMQADAAAWQANNVDLYGNGDPYSSYGY